ncbi:Crp/Fnr family transcriptional regulator [Lentzea sp. NBRC 105346]|uniref:Crp/Fnr family transcriptional regulator n=1 Tax=Lentzea sp. NBRC 105346 TaxID=3032205 RepID=UPI00249FD744|nr:Crp/Fnr family transcriptional regulator [Lentzea sp. NBRC 105346]GLZ34476.1 Crp/Fnr family transcriptional regulator [Lentzea sp. NBRC 105346]
MSDEMNFAARLSESELAELGGRGRQVRIGPGYYLMRQGEPGDCIVLIVSGLVKIVRSDHTGDERLLGIRGPGELVGEMACIDDRPRSASVLAHTLVIGIKIARNSFLEFLRDRSKVAYEVLRQGSLRLREAESKQEAAASDSVDVRVLRELVSLAGRFGGDGEAVIPLCQRELAQLVWAAEVTVQRSLRSLRDRRLVRTEYGCVVVDCVDCLRRAAAEPNGTEAVLGCGGSSGED